MSIPFDTLKLADRLAAGGFTSEQAKTAASALSEAFAADLATKADISEVRHEVETVRHEVETVRREVETVRHEVETVRHEVETVRHELRTEIADAKTEMIKWLVGTIGFQTIVILGALFTLVKLFVK